MPPISHDTTECCGSCAQARVNADRVSELEELLQDVTLEVERIAAFADAMHGNAYSGGKRRAQHGPNARRPVFRILRSDGDHPSIIAFDSEEIWRRVTSPFRRVHLRPAIGWGAGLASLAAVSIFLASVVSAPAPTAISGGTYVTSHHAQQEQARREVRRAVRSALILLPPRPHDAASVRFRIRLTRWRFILTGPVPVRPPVGPDGRHKTGSGSSSPTAPPATSPSPSTPGTSSSPNASTPVPSAS